jgi:phosphocarrier protein
MTLAAGYGDEVVISAEGEGAEEAVEAVAQLVATDLDA